MAARFVRSASSVLAPSFCKIFQKTTALSARLPAQINNVRKQCMQQRAMSSAKPLMQKETVTIHFQTSEGEDASVQAKVGDNLLDVIIENNVDIDGFGACEGTLACSTCHLIFKQEHFDQIPDKPTDEELDMLDLAYSLTDTSRLGCQVIVTKDMEGWEVHVPAGVSDAREL